MNIKTRTGFISIVSILGAITFCTSAVADICRDVSWADFTDAVDTAYTETNQFGFGLPMWTTLMDQTGKVCYVYSVRGGATPELNGGGDAGNNAWLGSRMISAQKANTANAFSLDGLAISTGALSVAVYPGGSLYGLQHSNPVNATIAYRGSPNTVGTRSDFLRNKRPGGINVFGGGVALYDGNAIKVGSVGASGDTSCRDHTLAYRLRIALGLNNQPNDDGLAFVAVPAALFEQPACGVNDPAPSAFDSGAGDFGSR